MRFFKSFCRTIDRINSWTGEVVAWSAVLVVLTVFADVIMRYMFQTSFVFVQEMEWHLFAFIFLMGAGYTLLKDGHVRVDIIYQRLTPKGQAWVNLLGVLLFLLPACYMVIATSLKFAHNSWLTLEGSGDPGGLPFRFIIKSAIPIGFILVALQGLALGIRSFFTIRGQDLDKESES